MGTPTPSSFKEVASRSGSNEIRTTTTHVVDENSTQIWRLLRARRSLNSGKL